jgi:pilus assembly protein Flp/PilA
MEPWNARNARNFSKPRNDIEARRWLTCRHGKVGRTCRDESAPARFLCEESGSTEIGYSLIAAGMAVAIITVLSGLGSKLSMALTTVLAALE